MTRTQVLYDCRRRVASHFRALSAAQQVWLSLAVLGMTLSKSGLLNHVVLSLSHALGVTFNAARERLRYHYKDADFDPSDCFAPLLELATAGFSGKRLALALDPTNIGDRFTVLVASVVSRGGAVPVAWRVVAADQKGSWDDIWAELLGGVSVALGAGWSVYVLTDRGLQSKALFGAITARGWHPLMRVKARGHFRPKGWHKGWPMDRFAAKAGDNWRGTGVAWPDSSKPECTLLARRDDGHETPWLILTDLAPADASAAWYARRAWIECGFRDLKSDGWNLAKTRMSDPARVARWWAAAALATLWVMEAGQQAEALEIPATRTHARPSGPPVNSLFSLGLAWLAWLFARGRARRRPPLAQPRWTPDCRPNDPLDETQWINEQQSLPQ